MPSAPNLPKRPLNPQQEIASAHVLGPLLVRAGAGTGKTTVLVERIFRLVRDGHATADQILAITYTKEAAQQLQHRATARLEAEIGVGAANGLRTSTFHGCCNGILERNGMGFGVLDKCQLTVFLHRALDDRKLALKHFIKASDTGKYLSDFLDFYDRCNDELVDATLYAEFVSGLRKPGAALPRVYRSKEESEYSREEIVERCEEIAQVFSTIETLLSEKNIGPYGQQIVRAVKLLRERPELRKIEQQQTKFLLIDEFQDCNLAQIEFVHLIGGDAANIFAVGDPDQAIYRFRGATSGAFDEFLARFPHAKITTLAENYRSTQTILDVAHSAISANPESDVSYARTPLTSYSDKGTSSPSHPVEVVLHSQPEDEAHDIAQAIASIRAAHQPRWKDFAILYRSHTARMEIVQELASQRVPFVVMGVDLLETDTLRDMVAVLRVLDSPADSLSLFRLAIMPHFNVDLAELQHQLAHARREQPLIETLKNTKRGSNVLSFLAKLRANLDLQKFKASEIVNAVIVGLQLDPNREEVASFRGFIQEWQSLAITETGLLREFVQYLDYFLKAGGELKQQRPESLNAVQVMSVHGAKGLEFPYVFVLRIASASFPTNYRERLFAFPDELRQRHEEQWLNEKELHYQEERRLFYVAVTRARLRLWLHGRVARGKVRIPAQFLRELTGKKEIADHLEVRDAEAAAYDIAASALQEPPAWLSVPVKNGADSLVLSDSAIARYEACPLQYKLSREWKLPSEPLANLLFGAAMHQVLHEYYKSVIAKRPYSTETVLQRFRDQWSEALIPNPLQRELYEKNGVEQLTNFLAAVSDKDVIATERSFELTIDGVKLIGRVDRVDAIDGRRVEIVDYKTGTPRDEKTAKKSLQLAIYALAAERAWGYIPEKLVLLNLEDNSRVEVVPTSKLLAEAEERIAKVASEIRAGNFEPKQGFHCRWCGYYSLCPSTRQELLQISVAAVN